MDISAGKIERLAASAGVEYETARVALLEADGDLIEAVLLLERQGKVSRRGARYNTCGDVPAHTVGRPSGADGLGGQVIAASGGNGACASADMDADFDGTGCGGRHGADSGNVGNTGSFGGAGNSGNSGAGIPDSGGYGNFNGGSSDNYGGYGGYGNFGSAGYAGGCRHTGGYAGSTGYTDGYGHAGHAGNGHAGGAGRQYRDESTGFEDFMRKVGVFLQKAFHAGCVNHFEVWREERRILFLPVLLLIVFLIPLFWLVLVLLVIGLFCRCRYRFSGPNLGRRDVNDAMDGAADAAERFKKEARDDRKNPK
jgi:hypothetical protein